MINVARVVPHVCRSFRAVSRTLLSLAAAITLFAAAGCRDAGGGGGGSVDLVSVLDRMSSPAGFAVPVEGRMGLVSTYDRTGGNMDWVEWNPAQSPDGQYLLADLAGPGCLTRIWTTGCEVDEWRLYVDGEATPRIRGSKFDIFGGQAPVLTPLADRFSGAAHTYLPVPFARSLRVAVYAPKIPPGTRPYYHIGYTRFDARMKVSSFPASLSGEESAAVVRLRDAWDSVEEQARALVAGAQWKGAVVQPGKAETLEAVQGAGTIAAFAVRLKGLGGMSALDRPRVLRSLVLECRWDGASVPSVEAPFGDFFCNGLAFRSFASLPLAQVDGAFVCRFPMPFRSGAEIRLRNDGATPISVESWTKLEAGTAAGGMYLHAGWSGAMSLGGPFRVLRADGNGHYVGCYLISYGMDGTWSILEGDESFSVDGESVPSWHGTGLEDYFNGGWYYYGLFERALYGLLDKAAMRTAQYRFHLSDPIRFRKSLQMQIEFGDANRARGYMSAVAYWYQDKPSAANSSIPAVSQRYPPLERVGLTAAMSELFELEKAGLIPDAVERCRYYEALFAGNAYGPMFGLRGIAYRETMEGGAAVRPLYASLASRSDIPREVASQAGLLHWAGESANRALLGMHAPGDWRLYLDGRQVGEGNSPFEYKAYPVELTPGEHWVMAEVTPRTQGAFFSACLRTSFSNITSDAEWEYSKQKPEEWPGRGGSTWRQVSPGVSMFPQMAWWQFVPNAFVGMQHGWQVVQPFSGWDQQPGKTVYLRRKVVVPPEGGAPRVPFPRRKEIRTPPERPVGDTSNEGLSR
jgi:hypothetical protein